MRCTPTSALILAILAALAALVWIVAANAIPPAGPRFTQAGNDCIETMPDGGQRIARGVHCVHRDATTKWEIVH